MPDHILALDQGTSSSKALLFDHENRICAIRQESAPLIFPQAAWVEQDPLRLWESQLNTAQAAIAASPGGAQNIRAIGISNQRETSILWERLTGRPLHNAISWQCRRTAKHCEKLRADGCEPMIREKTGLLADPYFSATKLAWLLDAIPDARKRADKGELCWGTVDSWLLFKLTGKHRTDVSNASRSMLFNIRSGKWDEELLKLFRVPERLLPEIMPSKAEFGMTRKEFFGREIPVTAMLGDQQASLFGQACFKSSAWKNTYGTGCFMLAPTGSSPVFSKHKLLTTVAWDCGNGLEYALEGAVFIGGELIKWLRDQVGIIPDAASSENMANSVPDSGGVYLVPAFAGLGAPYWDADARGSILGLTGGTKQAHIARAALESIAFQSAELFDAFASETGGQASVLQADGGACANNFLMQFQADTLGIPVRTAAIRETTALGAAWMAGLGCGFWKNENELAAQWKAGAEYLPRISGDKRKQLLADWKKAVAATRSFRP